MSNSALELLLQRRSFPLLQAPAPDAGQLDLLMRAAARAPDHGGLKPYRFLVVQGERLAALGALYAEVQAAQGEQDPNVLARTRGLPLRAPMLIVAIACLREHPKAPLQEQLLTAGLASFQIINAAEAMGLGAYWRTGWLAYDAEIAARLGLAEGEQIIGYLYLGTPKTNPQRTEPAETTTPAAPASWSSW